jgi:hypothetical protein
MVEPRESEGDRGVACHCSVRVALRIGDIIGPTRYGCKIGLAAAFFGFSPRLEGLGLGLRFFPAVSTEYRRKNPKCRRALGIRLNLARPRPTSPQPKPTAGLSISRQTVRPQVR